MPLISEGPSKTTALRPYMNVDEAAAFLRTTRRAVYALIERGQLEGCVRRFGRRILISRKDLVVHIEASAAEVTTP